MCSVATLIAAAKAALSSDLGFIFSNTPLFFVCLMGFCLDLLKKIGVRSSFSWLKQNSLGSMFLSGCPTMDNQASQFVCLALLLDSAFSVSDFLILLLDHVHLSSSLGHNRIFLGGCVSASVTELSGDISPLFAFISRDVGVRYGLFALSLR